MKKIAVILSGCGNMDGAEIHESVTTLLAIDKEGASYQCFAPDIPQHHVINHMTGQKMNETRNVMIESARIARGKIKPLSEYNCDEFDAIILPGGYGAAKNLSNFASEGENCIINSEVEKAIISTHNAGKPIGALCISPVLIAKTIKGAKLTIGNDKTTAKAIENMGGIHEDTGKTDITIDKENKIITTACYMFDSSIKEIAKGAENLVKAIMKL